MKRYVIQNLKSHTILPKPFKTKALAFQYLNRKYPSLYQREDLKGHYLGGFSSRLRVFPSPFRVITFEIDNEINQEDLRRLEDYQDEF
ncbi:hypothetical protein R4B61_07635 (plasmid) [Fructilactobacillus vespulae]|uniref:hypothetical protein n=1 Tax=Fructilactobacillus vespulae TaxID=1249630 RepID=UPI0039B57CEC